MDKLLASALRSTIYEFVRPLLSRRSRAKSTSGSPALAFPLRPLLSEPPSPAAELSQRQYLHTKLVETSDTAAAAGTTLHHHHPRSRAPLPTTTFRPRKL